MKISYEKISPDTEASFTCIEWDQPELYCPHHFHPELEITQILANEGDRLVGDSFDTYVPGDLAMFGSDLPHRYQNRKSGRNHTRVVQFLPDAFGADFFNLPEFRQVRQLFQDAARGLRFIGYHARAGTPDAIIDHTMSGNVTDFAMNGVSLPEAGINALIAGLYGVPVVFVAGDQAICDQVTELFGNVGTVAVKQGIGAASDGLHPDVANTRIREGVAEAVRNRSQYRPYTMTPPYTMVLKLKSEASIYNGSFFPGAQRTGDWELTFTSEDLLQVIYAFNVMNR